MKTLNHLDDIGSTPGSVIAWAELRRAGVVRSASVMVPCPWYPMARDDWLAEPAQDLGLHVTLTSEWDSYRWRPLLGQAGGLTDDEGFLHRRPGDVAANADPAAVADEMEAQLDRLLADGIRPTHIDAHMGTAFLPPFGPLLVEMGKRHDIPVLVCRDADILWRAVGAAAGDPGYIAEMVAEAEAAGWPVFDRFIMGFCADDQAIEAHVKGLLAGAGPGLNYFALHADTADGMGHFAAHHQAPRRKEYELFRHARSARLFAAAEIVDWRLLTGSDR